MFYAPFRELPSPNTIEELYEYAYSIKSPIDWIPQKNSFYQIRNQVYLISNSVQKLYLVPEWPQLSKILQKSYLQLQPTPDVPKEKLFAQQHASQWKTLVEYSNMVQWSHVFPKCKAIADQKGILPCDIPMDLFDVTDVTFHPHELKAHYPDVYSRSSITFYGMINPSFWQRDSHFVGTFIFIQNFLLVCDEYGRTFLLQAKNPQSPLDEAVNRLLDTGYTFATFQNGFIDYSKD